MQVRKNLLRFDPGQKLTNLFQNWPQCVACSLTARNLSRSFQATDGQQACGAKCLSFLEPSRNEQGTQAMFMYSSSNELTLFLSAPAPQGRMLPPGPPQGSGLPDTYAIRAQSTLDRLKGFAARKNILATTNLSTASMQSFENAGGNPGDAAYTVAWEVSSSSIHLYLLLTISLYIASPQFKAEVH